MSPSRLPPDKAGSPKKPGRRRFGRAQSDHLIDPYKQPAKPHEPLYCTQCGAVYETGRWRWSARPEDASPSLCQACHRINDRFPAGILTLSGEAVGEHRDEIIRLARHQEQAEKDDHPLNRIMDIADNAPGQLEISTTDIHLPRRIANALRRAYTGEVAEHFDEGGYFVRVSWRQG